MNNDAFNDIEFTDLLDFSDLPERLEGESLIDKRSMLYLLLASLKGDDKYGPIFAHDSHEEQEFSLIDAWDPKFAVDYAKWYSDYSVLAWILRNGSVKSKAILLSDPDATNVIAEALEKSNNGSRGKRTKSARIKDRRDMFLLSRVHHYRAQGLPLKNDTSISACSKAAADHQLLIKKQVRNKELLIEADGVYRIWKERKKRPWYNDLKKSGYFDPPYDFVMTDELKKKRDKALNKLREEAQLAKSAKNTD